MADHFPNSEWPAAEGHNQVKLFNPNQFGQQVQQPFQNQTGTTEQDAAANGFNPQQWSAPPQMVGNWGQGSPALSQPQKMAPPVQHQPPPMNYSSNTFAAGPVNAFPPSPQHQQWSHSDTVVSNGPTAGSQYHSHAAPAFDHHQHNPAQTGQYVDQSWNPGQQNTGAAYQVNNGLDHSGVLQYTENLSMGDSVDSLGNKMEEVQLNDSSSYGASAEPQNQGQQSMMPASNSFSKLEHQPSPFDSIGSPAPTPAAPEYHSPPQTEAATAPYLFPASQAVSAHSRNSSVGGIQFIVGSNSSSTSPSTSHSPTASSTGQIVEENQGSTVLTGADPPQMFSPERPPSVSSTISNKEPGRPSSVQSTASAEVAGFMQPTSWAGQHPQPIPELQQPVASDSAMLTERNPGTDWPQGLVSSPVSAGVAAQPQAMNSPPIVSQSSISPAAAAAPPPSTVGPPKMGGCSPLSAAGNPFRKGKSRSPYTPPPYTGQGVSQSTGTGSSAQGFQPSPVTTPFSAGPVNVQAHTEITSSQSEAPVANQVNTVAPSMSLTPSQDPQQSMVTPEEAQPAASDQSHNLDIYASPIVPHPQGPFRTPSARDEPVNQGSSEASMNLTPSNQNNPNQAPLGHGIVSDNREQNKTLSDYAGFNPSHAPVSATENNIHGGQIPVPVQTPDEFKTSPFYQQQKQSETKQQGTFSPPLTLWETPAQGHPGITTGFQLAPAVAVGNPVVVPGQQLLTGNNSGLNPIENTTFQNSTVHSNAGQNTGKTTMPGIVPLSPSSTGEPQNIVATGSKLNVDISTGGVSPGYSPPVVPQSPQATQVGSNQEPRYAGIEAVQSDSVLQTNRPPSQPPINQMSSSAPQMQPTAPHVTAGSTSSAAPQGSMNPPNAITSQLSTGQPVSPPAFSPQSSLSSQHSLTNTGDGQFVEQSTVANTNQQVAFSHGSNVTGLNPALNVGGLSQEYSAPVSSQGAVQATPQGHPSLPSHINQPIPGSGYTGNPQGFVHNNTPVAPSQTGSSTVLTGGYQPEPVSHHAGSSGGSTAQYFSSGVHTQQVPVETTPAAIDPPSASTSQMPAISNHMTSQQAPSGQTVPGQFQGSSTQISGQMQGSAAQVQGHTAQIPGQQGLSSSHMAGHPDPSTTVTTPAQTGEQVYQGSHAGVTTSLPNAQHEQHTNPSDTHYSQQPPSSVPNPATLHSQAPGLNQQGINPSNPPPLMSQPHATTVGNPAVPASVSLSHPSDVSSGHPAQTGNVSAFNAPPDSQQMRNESQSQHSNPSNTHYSQQPPASGPNPAAQYSQAPGLSQPGTNPSNPPPLVSQPIATTVGNPAVPASLSHPSDVSREGQGHPAQTTNVSAFNAPSDSQHRRNESHDSLINEFNVDKNTGDTARQGASQPAEETQNQYSSRGQYHRTDSQDSRHANDQRGYEDYYRREGDRRYNSHSYSGHYGKQDSYDPHVDRRYDPRYDPYRDPDYDQRYDPHRPPSRSGHPGDYRDAHQQERSRARSRQGHPEDPRDHRDSSRHGREERARSTSRSRYEGDRSHGYDNNSSGYGYQDRPRSRHGYDREEDDYRRRYEQYYNQGHYDSRYQRDRYQRGYESEMQTYQGQQYYDQYGNPYSQQDYYSHYGYYPQQQHSYNESDRHSVHSRGSTPGFDHPAYTSHSGADHFAQEFHQGSRPSSRASGTYEQSPIYVPHDATQHGYYEQSYAGYESYTAPQQQPLPEPEPARRTPHKHTIPHMRASFAPNGHMIKVLANQPQEGQPACVEITEATGVYAAVHAEELKLFPGPLVKGETHKNDVLRFCQNKIKELDSSVGMIDRESAQLLWRYLELLIKQNGTVVGTDLADLLMEGHEQSAQNLPLSGSGTDAMETTSAVLQPGVEGEGQVTSDRVLVSQPAKTTALDRFRQLCLFGRKKEALEFAMKAGLWEQALFLAQRMGPRISASVYTRFMNSALSVNDPLRTMYQLMSGRQPAACTMVGDERFGDWRPHLAILLSHPSDKPELDYKSIVSMGDSFAAKSYLYASQICYLMAGSAFQDFSKKTAKLVLLGSNHSLSLEEFASNTAIQCTEIYEYATSLAKPDHFCIPTLQVFKYLYTTRLVDAGMLEEAIHYCEVLAGTLSQNPGLYSQTLVQQVADLGDRIKAHDPQRLVTDQELPDPAWLTTIQAVAQQYNSGLIQHVAPSSGTHTPAAGAGDTRSSSEVAEIMASAASVQSVADSSQYTHQQQGTTDVTQIYGQGVAMDTQQQTAQQPQMWDPQQQQPAVTTGNQPLELWDATTGTWTYTDGNASQAYQGQQQQQQAGMTGMEGVESAPQQQWGAAQGAYQEAGPYTDYNTQQQALQSDSQSYQTSDASPSQYTMTTGQEVLHTVPEHQEVEAGGATEAHQVAASNGGASFDYYGTASSTMYHYGQTLTNHSNFTYGTAAVNGKASGKLSESSGSASDSDTESTDSASTVNDTSSAPPPSMATTTRAPPTYRQAPPPPPPSTVYPGYKQALCYAPSTFDSLPAIAEVSPTVTGSEASTPKASPHQSGVFQFEIPPPPSPLYRASDPATPLGAVQDTGTNDTESKDEGDGQAKKKPYWPGEDEDDNKKLMQAAKKTDPKAAEKAKSGEGILSRFFGIGKKNKNEMKLPDDKKKSIVWDKSKGAWVDTTSDADSSITTNSAPPPKDTDLMRKMSMPAGMMSTVPSATDGSSAVDGNPPAGTPGGTNRFSRGKMPRGARSQYVDVLKGKAKPAATAPPNLFNVLPKSQSVPANIFIPSGKGVPPWLSPVADAAIDHHAHQTSQANQEANEAANQTDTQSSNQPPAQETSAAAEQDNLSRSSSQSSLATEVQYYFQQPQPPAASQPDVTQNYYYQQQQQQQNYDYSQSQKSSQQHAPLTQDYSQSQNSYQQQAPPSQSFGQSQSAFKQPVAPPPQMAAGQSEAATSAMPQFFNPASMEMKNNNPQGGGASRLSRYGQGSRRPQYPKQ